MSAKQIANLLVKQIVMVITLKTLKSNGFGQRRPTDPVGAFNCITVR